MSKVTVDEIQLVGISLKTKTSNANGQSSIDCKNLWHQFEDGKYADTIPNKLSQDIYGVYHDYEGDSSQPFSYFIGCPVANHTGAPTGLEKITIPAGIYQKVTATGTMPDCVIKAWKDIWAAGYARTYQTDFEVYDDRSKDWNKAEMDVYVSIEE